MFKGEYQHSIDSKGRVIMPAKFRAALGDNFVVTKGLDNNLFVFSNEEWDKFCEKLSKLPVANKKTRAFTTWFYSSAIDCETDKQGRILITPPLRAYASLLKDVTVIGNGNKVEIWSSESWNEYVSAIDPQDLADGFDDLGVMF